MYRLFAADRPSGRAVLAGPYGENAEVILYHDVELEPRPSRTVT